MTISFDPQGTPIKHCPICDKRTPWPQLKLLGYQPSIDDQGNACWLEMRNCTCGGTFAVECKERGP